MLETLLLFIPGLSKARTAPSDSLKRRKFIRETAGACEAFSEQEAKTVEAGLRRAQARLGTDLFHSRQIMGRREAIGCTAVEITQRCNLDCSLCYLSDMSEDIKDIPMEEVKRRIDDVYTHYGPNIPVQITGGDPTMRDHDELVEIVRYTRSKGLLPALFTNGIRASRELLVRLTDAGLMDIAFHVDLTQERPGYSTEQELHSVRDEYIERTKGLGLTVIFNTTLFDGNFAELEELSRYFTSRSDKVRMASFQLQADTGRGELRERDHGVISVPNVKRRISNGAGASLPWDALNMGHQDCNSMAPFFLLGEQIYNPFRNSKVVERWLEDFKHVTYDRRFGIWRNIWPFVRSAVSKPYWWFTLPVHLSTEIARNFRALLKARGKINRFTFFIHNFMDAKELEQKRVDACSFMVMTAEGPVSMCEHNARRNEFLLTPIRIKKDGKTVLWNPLRDRPMKNRKARGERQWKKSSLSIVQSH